ncbi:hypothetical protein AKG95_04585 [Janthinobacterium lividum]|uniref:Uncharacterized protein n=1 Tax=Janthinobacterium lividum TaxID=29581 RepID=A0A1S1UDV1_9BURK|nr:hypothetical protein AKG95_04585 [Janthinobacterium lividum]
MRFKQLSHALQFLMELTRRCSLLFLEEKSHYLLNYSTEKVSCSKCKFFCIKSLKFIIQPL